MRCVSFPRRKGHAAYEKRRDYPLPIPMYIAK